MKKFFSVLLTVLTAAVLAFSLTACEKPSEGLDYELNENQNAYMLRAWEPARTRILSFRPNIKDCQ